LLIKLRKQLNGGYFMKKLLVVDDETDVCDFIEGFFGERDFEVTVAKNGQEALDIVEAQRPEIVLLDIRIPVVDGFKTFERIKQIDRKIKIIFITAYSDFGKTKKRLLEEGAYAFVEKPIASLKELESLVNNAAEADK